MRIRFRVPKSACASKRIRELRKQSKQFVAGFAEAENRMMVGATVPGLIYICWTRMRETSRTRPPRFSAQAGNYGPTCSKFRQIWIVFGCFDADLCNRRQRLSAVCSLFVGRPTNRYNAKKRRKRRIRQLFSFLFFSGPSRRRRDQFPIPQYSLVFGF